MVEYVNRKVTATIVSVNQVTKERIVTKVRCLLCFMPYRQRCYNSGVCIYWNSIVVRIFCVIKGDMLCHVKFIVLHAQIVDLDGYTTQSHPDLNGTIAPYSLINGFMLDYCCCS